MSKRARNGCEEEDAVELTVIQSGSGRKQKFSIPLSTTLKDFKGLLETNQTLGCVPVANQRIFFLGRELKTSGKTLSSLGVGSLGIKVLHVHSNTSNAAGRTEEISIDDDCGEEEILAVDLTSSNKQVVELLDEDNNDDEGDLEDVEVTVIPRRKRRR